MWRLTGGAVGVVVMGLMLAACDEAPQDNPAVGPDEAEVTDWSADQQAAYERCLEDNMAVAMAWEMIEQQCRDQVAGDRGNLLLPVE